MNSQQGYAAAGVERPRGPSARMNDGLGDSAMKSVLVLDDDQDLVEAISEIIELVANRRVLKLHSVDDLLRTGSAALSSELAILDINLGPGAPTGLDALRWLEAHHFAGRAVFLTGHAAGLPIVEAARAAGVPVLSKPITLEQLQTLLDGGTT
jgi:DNA-binding NtrC family response regulator